MRLRTTHTLTVYDEQQVGTNELGVALTESETPLAEIEGRYRPQGEGLIREERSSRIDRSPSVVVRPVGHDPDTGARLELLTVLEEGQRVVVNGIGQEFALRRIDPHFGRSGGPHRLTLHIEPTTDG